MFENEMILTEPLFYLLVAFSALLTLGFFWGRKKNRKIYNDAFQALVDTVKPDDQTFTSIGGVVGYHANLLVKRKGPVSRVDATITLLPRQSWLYFPVSKLIRRWDRLFITLYLKQAPPEEGHLIETKYAAFRGPKITSANRLNREDVRWGGRSFHLYSQGAHIRDALVGFMQKNMDPAIIRHIAVVPERRLCFIFMIPGRRETGRCFASFHQWVATLTSTAGAL